MFLLIDNYDSFTYNLVQAFYALGLTPRVVCNDDPTLLDLAQDPDLEMVCISPGPGRPEQAGFCLDFLNRLKSDIPVLGVCLGHQILGTFAKANVCIAPRIMHGKQSDITHNGQGLFKNLPNPMQVGRYHSLVVEAHRNDANPHFTVTARGPEGEVMALAYNDRPWVGVQFHPESVLTPDGLKILENFVSTVPGAYGKTSVNFAQVLDKVAERRELSAIEATVMFGKLMDGRLTPAQSAAFLLALRMKGESALELAHASRAALSRAILIEDIKEDHLDVVGTGGDGKHSFNCSTTAALVLAGMGYKITKHGNRAVSSTSGSADVLEALGLTLDKDPKSVKKMLQQRNFAFLFAPHFHPSFKNIAPIRKELGVRTLFNILGPLINPAKPTHLLMGVARPELLPLVAETLLQLSVRRAAVVCGAGDYDEVTPIGPARIMLLHQGKVEPLPLDPANFAIPTCQQEDLAVHSLEEAVSVVRALLEGQGPVHMQNMLILNVGLGVYLMEENMNLEQCMSRAREAVLSGAGKQILKG